MRQKVAEIKQEQIFSCIQYSAKIVQYCMLSDSFSIAKKITKTQQIYAI